MVEIIYRKSKYINKGSVKVYNNNKQLVKMIRNPIQKEAIYAQEGGAEIVRIK